MDVQTGVFDHRCAVGKHAVSTSDAASSQHPLGTARALDKEGRTRRPGQVLQNLVFGVLQLAGSIEPPFPPSTEPPCEFERIVFSCADFF